MVKDLIPDDLDLIYCLMIMMSLVTPNAFMTCRLMDAYQRSRISNNRRFDHSLQLSRRLAEYRNGSFVKVHTRNRCSLRSDLREVELRCSHSNRLDF